MGKYVGPAMMVVFGVLLFSVVLVRFVTRNEPSYQPNKLYLPADLQGYVRSEDGYWISLSKIYGFKVVETFPGKYSVLAYLSYSSYTLKSGFFFKDEAEQWLLAILQKSGE